MVKFGLVAACALINITTVLGDLSKTIINTTNGQLTGFANPHKRGVTTFYGVPYGKDTGGKWRWKAPRAVASWKGVKSYDSFGFVCPDGYAPNGALITGDFKVSEDCLNSNIWTGAKTVNDELPVYVWLHGAGASGNDYMFDGAALASKGLVVVVLNHRTNVFGYLAHPDLDAESSHHASGNYAYLDEILALKWIKKNIAAFGGDPSRVTIGGQSAGCSRTNILAASPLTVGLIHGAISESGIRFPNDTCIPKVAENYVTLDIARIIGVDYAASRNASSINSLRAMNTSVLLKNIQGVTNPGTNVMDGYVFPSTYFDSLTNGYPNRIPILTGNNAAESGAETSNNITLTEFQQMANATFGPYGLYEAFLELYPAANDLEATSMHNANASDVNLVGDWLFSKMWATSSCSPIYTYFFTRAPPDQGRGAYREAEIYYAFNNFYANSDAFPWTDVDYRIGDTMSTYWYNFIKTGNPNGHGLNHWPQSRGSQAQTFHIDDGFFNVTSIATPARIGFIEKYWSLQTKAF